MKRFYLLLIFVPCLVYAQDPLITGKVVSKSTYQNSSIHATQEISLLAGFTAPAGFEAKIVPYPAYNSECSTPSRDTDEFVKLPWVGNEQYLPDLLDSLGYPIPEENPCTNCRIEPTSQVKYRIPIKLWVYRRSDGTGGPTEVQLQEAIDEVNEHHRLRRTGIRFYIKCGITEIRNNDKLFISLTEGYFLAKWIGGNNEEGAANIHIVERNGGDGADGRNFYNSLTHHTFIQWDVLRFREYSTFTHELGHFLGLDHTHQYHDIGAAITRCWKEPVDRSRRFSTISACINPFQDKRMCATTGDGLCDTPADPESDTELSCAFNRTYAGRDHFGDSYANPPAGSFSPDVTNIMGYYTEACRDNLTPGQIGVMLHSIERKSGFNVGPSQNRQHRDGWKSTNAIFDDFEPNDTRGMARQINLERSEELTFHKHYDGIKTGTYDTPDYTGCDIDWVRFRVNGNNIRISTHAVSGKTQPNTRLTLFDANGNQLAQNDDIAPGSNLFSNISATGLVAGNEYFVRVENLTPNIVGYYQLYVGCTAFDTPPFVSGPGLVCSGGTTYTLNNHPAGATVTWSVSANLRLVNTNTDTEGRPVAIVETNGEGSGQITATVSTGSCGNLTYSQTVDVRNSQITWSESPNLSGLCPFDQIQVSVSVTGGASSYVWDVQGNLRIVSGQGTNRVSVNATDGFQFGVLRVTVVNSCGVTQNASKSYGRSSACSGSLQYTVYPNPADETVEIAAAENLTDESEETNQAAESPFEVELYNIVGEQKLKDKTKQKGEKLKLNVKHLPEGVYILHIINPEGVVQKQLQIQR